MLIDFLFSIALPILLFLPGYFVLSWLQNAKLIPSLTFWSRFIAGGALWPFVLIGSSTLIGIVSSDLPIFFDIFATISILIVIFGFLHWIYHGAPLVRPQSIPVVVMPAAALLITLFVASYFQTPYFQWDGNKVYLPYALAISQTGGLLNDPFRLTALTDTALPGGPIIFAWVLRYTQIAGLAVTGVLVVALTSLCVYKIAREFMGKEASMISAFVFLAFPAVLMSSSTRYLYLDLPFVFFYSVLVWTVIRALKTRQDFWVNLSMVSASLLLLTREFAVFLIPPLCALILAKTQRLTYRIFSVATFGLTFNLLTLWDLTHFPQSYWETILLRWSPTAFFTMVFTVFAFQHQSIESTIGLRGRSVAVASAWLIPFAAFVVRNLTSFGAITINWTLFGGLRSDPVFSEAMGYAIPSLLQSYPKSIVDYFRFDLLVFSLGAAGMFLLPCLFGFGILGRHSLNPKQFDLRLFACGLFSLLMLHSYFFPGDFGVRRFYLIAPLVAICVGAGLIKIPALFNLTPKQSTAVALTTVSFSVALVWRLALVSETINSLETAAVSGTRLNPAMFVLSFALPVLLALFVESAIPLRFPSFFAMRRMLPRLKLSVLLSFFLFLLTFSAFTPLMADAIQNGTTSMNYIWPNWEGGLIDAISFYKANIHDSFTTVGFYANELIFYAHRSLIDLTRLEGVATFLPVLHASTPDDVMSSLLALNIRYFLLPLPSHPVYSTYMQFHDRYLVFKMIDSLQDFVFVRSFADFRLVRFVAPSETANAIIYSTYFHQSWNATNQYSKLALGQNTTIISGTPYEYIITDDNQTAYWRAELRNPRDTFLISNDNSNLVSGNDSLRIELNMTSSASLSHYYFSAPADFSAYSGLSFYWFGSNSSAQIEVTIHTTPWVDFLYSYFADNFQGWGRVLIPFASMHSIGNPNLSKIEKVEILFGSLPHDVLFNFWMDRVSVQGGRFGLTSYANNLTVSIQPLFAQLKIVQVPDPGTLQVLLTISTTDNQTTWSGKMVSDGSGSLFYVRLPDGLRGASFRLTIEFVTSQSAFLLELFSFEVYVYSFGS